MGNISSRQDEAPALYLKDQTRFAFKYVTVSNGRRKTVLNLVPNASPATRLFARRDVGDDNPVSYIQEPDSPEPRLLLRLDLEDELEFRFTFITKQAQVSQTQPATNGQVPGVDTIISGLTFAYASTTRDLDTLVTREFHADPNLHKNSNVQLIGDFGTNGSSSVEYEWSWRWRPPKASEDRGGGWRNTCSFLEYDSRAHRLNTLANFVFWVQNTPPLAQTPISSPHIELSVTPLRKASRIPSSQSYHSQISDSEGPQETNFPPSPIARIETTTSTVTPSITPSPAPAPVIDVACQRPGEDMSIADDGPVFRATMKSLEGKTGNMRVQIKKVLKRAEAAHQAQLECNDAMNSFLQSLQEASSSNASAFKPALDHYFTKTAKKILQYENEQSNLLRRQIIDPLSKLYNLDIKQADSKKKDFEEESRDYYAYVSRYLGQRQDSLKEKKRAESDSKYQAKKKNFELARFDYSAFMQDLHGGRKEQELLSQLTKYADGQTKAFLSTAKAVENLSPQLDALLHEVNEADKEYKLQRTEREEKRRNLEMNTIPHTPEIEPISQVTSNPSVSTMPTSQGGYTSDTDLSRADSTSSQFGYNAGKTLSPMNSISRPTANGSLSTSPGTSTLTMNANKFRGIRDLEERDPASLVVAERQASVQHRKEGLLWALSKPGSHIDPKGINKQAWHKFWIVLDQGKLSEYSNWKDKLDLHREPIDLRIASVRIARDAERRFCFEVITPNYKRVYQATTEDEMNHWINAINNALQSAFEGRSGPPSSSTARTETSKSEYGAVLVGKRLSQSGQHGLNQRSDSGVNRSSTVGARPIASRNPSSTMDVNPTKLLDQLRANDQGNLYCADCGSNSRVEWTSLNLGIILCIECGGIHRSLGTHISKVRSLTLDSYSFTDDVIELLMQVGNRISNMVWEAKLEPRIKPEPWAKREDRLKYITTKYVERAFVDMTALNSGFVNVDDSLLASIKRNDVQGVLSAIAHRANVNAHDRSRNTHTVHLALIAADPARPVSPAPGSTANPSLGKKVTFPVAELLIQNGAEVPLGVPLFPLSSAALAYLDTRRAK